jgi:O-antigen/teichoic acid export membrane protein
MTQVTMTGGPGPPVTGLGRHMSWTYLNVLALAVTNIVITAVAVRRLGPAEYGVVALLLVIATGVVVLDFGLSAATVRATAGRSSAVGAHEAGHLGREVSVAHSTYVVLGIGVFLLGLFGAAVVASLRVEAGVSTAALVVSIVLVAAWGATFIGSSAVLGVATGCQSFRTIAISGVVGCIVNLGVVLAGIDHLGIVAVALGQLTGLVVQRVWLALSVRRRAIWFGFRPRRASRPEVARVWGFALPLVAMAASAQVVSITDLVVIGWFSTAAAVGLYRVGSLLATQALSVLYRGYDVSFPALVRTRSNDDQDDAARFLGSVASFAAGLGFGVMFLYAPELIRLIAGETDPFASEVLRIFCAAWMVNVPAHGLALLLIARGRHRVMAAVVVGEAVANLVLTVVLVAAVGPVGAAWGTFVTLCVSNAVVLPLAVGADLRPSAVALVWRWGLLRSAAGAVIALAVFGVVQLWSGDLGQLLVGSALTAALGLAIGLAVTGADGRTRLRDMLRPAHQASTTAPVADARVASW